MQLTQAAAKLRSLIKHAGVKARVRVAPGGGSVQVISPTYEATFSEDDQRKIRSIAKSNRYTLVCGVKIDAERMTDPNQMDFYTA